ncbi:hypothetical protein Pst134EA_000444 [Puccinia striiformis f. sp. tritici]|uniref:hypothetical protein n=1 Tax=Puccinia striiformis f. sp. tritici TaxID=168172 RepID=UPI002007F276|nr:hypothetical protein Pst134EA_000444 [Puccinia striiformis f. sp. tritici]KAH9473371.1 hypothetical protein Pst134EA_000444 [Puccinia striiformis f. sp. tritici]
MGVMLDDTDVVVIGAGASGLAAIKQLTTTTELKVACFESRGGPAGVWNPDIKKGERFKDWLRSIRPVLMSSHLRSTHRQSTTV